MMFRGFNMHSLLFAALAMPSIYAATIPTFTTPSSTLSNGLSNPFYPCPATDVSSCPYRCYDVVKNVLPDNSSYTYTNLLPTCYSASQASSLLANSSAICMKCTPPLHKELAAVGLTGATAPSNTTSGEECTPLRLYFNAPSPDGSATRTGDRPSRCGFAGHRIDACAWDCAAAQVPFSVCDAKNTTQEFRVCDKCVPTCSSPRIVFNVNDGVAAAKPVIDKTFSLSNGTCATGAEEKRACPWRCVDDGAEMEAYCSLGDKTAEFTTCTAC